MQMTKSQWDKFRKDIEGALKQMAEKYGCEVQAGGIKYDSVSADVTVKFTQVQEGQTAEQVQFEQHCDTYGFTPAQYGRIGIINGIGTCKLVGFAPTARKYPCIVEAGDGKRFKTTIGAAMEAFRI